MANNANDVLKIARGEIGYSRWTDPLAGTKYGRWFAQDHGSYYGTNGVPYCAMFVSWVFAQAGASCAGLPEAYCPYILNKAKSAGKVLSNKKSAQPGDVVLFDWGGDGVCDHVGIVEKNYGGYIQTIEGNTSSGTSGSQSNGGVVARRTRSWGTVKAVVRPYYGSTSSGSTSTSKKRIEVDGKLGVNSVTAWQTDLGSYADGIFQDQRRVNQKYFPNLISVTFSTSGKSNGIVALQKFLTNHGYSCGDYGVDGVLGYDTVIALQKFLREVCGYVKHEINGILDVNTAANVQNAINAGYFKK